ncbi:MAG: glycoside hydrolase family 3 protein, partial [Alphaproteobacteria bacterium]|nr:glycoside hydrolase family 3 protein [Alphaproteobacteria bacterium]
MVLPIIASIGGADLGSEEAVLLKNMQPVGVSLFARNVVNRKQLKNLVGQIKNLLGERVLVAVDQEGGRVRRLAEPEWRSYASQFVLGQLPENVSKMHAALIAQDLNELGINLNYAPVLDRLCEKTHQVLKSRCFGNGVVEHGKAMIESYIRNGICPCMKHMPGHGQASVDPHLGLPVIDCSIVDFEEDMSYFAQNSSCPAGMTAHIVLPEVDSLPVPMSAKAIDYL